MKTLVCIVLLACSLTQVQSFIHQRPRVTQVLQATPKKSESFAQKVPSSTTTNPLSDFSTNDIDWEDIKSQLIAEAKEISECAQIAFQSYFQSDKSVEPEDLVRVCDDLEFVETDENLFVSRELQLRQRAIEFQRYELLVKLMRKDYDAYVATASFLSPSRIPRSQLPNIQDVPMDKNAPTQPAMSQSEEGLPLVADCELEDLKYQDSPLDKFLLSTFRKLVAQHSGVTSDKPGIEGLLEQGRTFMVKRGNIPEVQHKMVYNTLGGLMTPVLPPFYRIFMSGIFGDVQIGPWFYAPWLTSIVTPTFFSFLVGPSTPNRRKDGKLGGLVVEKCKFLQESGCKGLCLHQCKLPAQQFFQDELGLPLTVSPNFVTQECQWSFGEKPLPPEEDPSFPSGCLVGCESRKAMAGTNAELCSS